MAVGTDVARKTHPCCTGRNKEEYNDATVAGTLFSPVTLLGKERNVSKLDMANKPAKTLNKRQASLYRFTTFYQV